MVELLQELRARLYYAKISIGLIFVQKTDISTLKKFSNVIIELKFALICPSETRNFHLESLNSKLVIFVKYHLGSLCPKQRSTKGRRSLAEAEVF